jgi:photosystem II stability/assembly factor-like uncharacterized protein
MRYTTAVAAALVLAGGLTSSMQPRAEQRPPETSPPALEALLSGFQYRNMGPFRMGARIADIAVPAAPAKDHLYTIYVAPWTGGLFKTTNNGTTWEPLFDNQSRRLTVGAIGLSPTDTNLVWIGTGDAFTSRSSYAGDGVYKSTDAGKTWKRMGLEDSHHIARIIVHPSNAETVYVAAMGHLYSTNEERGVFKTTDGGATWQKILYLNEEIGVIDLVMNPKAPDTLYAATYDKVRLPHQMVNGGPESGIHKTTDGGRTWTRLAGGLPTGRIGRIGLDIYLRNSEILYAIVENDNTKPNAPPPQGPPGRVPIIGGEVYRSENGGQTWTKMNPDDYNPSSKGPYYFNQIRIDPNNDKVIFLTGSPGGLSRDGGKTWDRIFPKMFGDNRSFWFDPENSDRMIMASDGGIAISYDGGKTSDHLANIPLGELYMVGVDMEDPYNIYAGLQDHEHWRGPSTHSALRGISVHEWLAAGDGDGMYVQVDPRDSRWLYTTRHYGGHTRMDQKFGYETPIAPQAPPGRPPYRFIWATPIHISPHDSSVLYTGGQYLLRSKDRGNTWVEISPDLSTNPVDKILPESEGSVPGGIPWFALSSISESPVTKGVIWTGTTDGNVHVTRDEGKTWIESTDKLTTLGARRDGYVSRVRASSHTAGRAYVAKSGYKFDDFRPFLYRTDDLGATWKNIAGNLPQEPINVVWEDHRNPDLLFVGNDVGVFVSLDAGASWTNFNNNMPNVPVHDLVVHPRENDLVLGTYGRSLWVTNIAPLQELNGKVLTSDAHLFTIEPTVQRVIWSFGANDYLFGQRHAETPNEPYGMVIRYYLKEPGTSGANVVIGDAKGQQVAKLTGEAKRGINTVVWSTCVQRPSPQGEGRGRAGGGRAGGGGGRGQPCVSGRSGGPAVGDPLDAFAPLGDYTVTVEVNGRTLTQKAQIVKTQGWSLGPNPQVIRQLKGRSTP